MEKIDIVKIIVYYFTCPSCGCVTEEFYKLKSGELVKCEDCETEFVVK